MSDYNFEMTGQPSQVDLATNPDMANAWYAYSGTSPAPAPTWQTAPDFATNSPQAISGYKDYGLTQPFSTAAIQAPVDPSTIRYAYNNTPYAGVSSNIPGLMSGGEYVINPQTGNFALDANGNPTPVPQKKDISLLNDTNAGPLAVLALPALAAAGVALGAGAGAFGGAEGLGALGTDTALMGPTYGELGYAPALEATSATGAATQALPYTSSFDAANLYANGVTSSTQLGDILASTGIDPFLAADMGNLASQGLSADAISQILGYSYTPAELAGTGIDALGTAAGGNALSNLLKGAKSLIGSGAPLIKALSGASSASKLSSALKNPTSAIGGAGTTSTGMGSNFAQAKGNQNPFYFGTQTPVASASQSKADPFAALNVQQMTPQQQYNPLAALLKEGIYRG